MTIDMVDLPIENGDFPQFLYVYQRAHHKPKTLVNFWLLSTAKGRYPFLAMGPSPNRTMDEKS
jgi:hypothetical protein